MKPEHGLHDVEEERAVPWGDPGQFAWHRARYRFALPFARDARVVDVGAGEGYGAAMLAETAASVVGVDYSPAAVDHARATYPRPNLRFEVGDVRTLESSLGPFDLAVCFEVFEHIAEADALVDSLADVLSPGGTLLLSTPNRLVDELFESVSDHDHYAYHVNMVGPRELERQLRRRFSEIRVYGQSVRGNALHAALKAVDVLNLRHRLVRSSTAQRRFSEALGKADSADAGPSEFRFSRVLARQSPALLVVARVPGG